jgi:hypothetical protein
VKSNHETESKEELGDQDPCKLEHQKEKDIASSTICTFDIEPEKIDSQNVKGKKRDGRTRVLV